MKLYGAFQKIEEKDDGTLIVSGIASSEAVDSDGETVKAAAIEKALPDYMRFGAVREMHQASAAGVAVEAKVDTDTGKTEFSAHVVDPVAVKKVQTGVYKGFSIGGKVLKRDADDPKVITELRLTEISLVDRPANPDAVIALCKFDHADEGANASAAAAADDPARSSGSPAAENGQQPAGATKVLEVAGDGAIAKSMYTVRNLADLLQSIQYLAQDSEWEKQYEGDNSDAPAKIRAWLATGAEILKDVVAEEVGELVATVEASVKSEATGDLAKTESAADLTKKGARNSKADQDKVQAVHDHAVGLGAMCGDSAKVAKADAGETLAKVATLTDDLAKMTDECDTLKKRVEELEREPAAPKGALRVVEKGEDLGGADDAKKTEITDDDDALAAIKKVHAAGGTRWN